MPAPGAPTITSITPGDAEAEVTFDPPASDGGDAIIEYEVVAISAPTMILGPVAFSIDDTSIQVSYQYAGESIISARIEASAGATKMRVGVSYLFGYLRPEDSGPATLYVEAREMSGNVADYQLDLYIPVLDRYVDRLYRPRTPSWQS